MTQCQGLTQSGQPCQRLCQNKTYCHHHNGQKGGYRDRPQGGGAPCDANTRSWILYAVRNVMGYEDVRQMILQANLGSSGNPLEYGATLSNAGYTQTQYIKLVNNYIKQLFKRIGENKIVLFTATNVAVKGETHYQTYIVDLAGRKLYMIDPSMSPIGQGLLSPYQPVSNKVLGTMGTYSAFMSNSLGPDFQKKGFDVYWVHTSSRCQTTDSDVFCQSWSLYLQIQAVKRISNGKVMSPIDIPNDNDKYHILIDFYHSVFKQPEIAQILQEEYNDLPEAPKLNNNGVVTCFRAMKPNDLVDV
jgi:hypothetical protein